MQNTDRIHFGEMNTTRHVLHHSKEYFIHYSICKPVYSVIVRLLANSLEKQFRCLYVGCGMFSYALKTVGLKTTHFFNF